MIDRNTRGIILSRMNASGDGGWVLREKQFGRNISTSVYLIAIADAAKRDLPV